MPTPQQVLSDPNFQALPMGERLKVMRSVDPNFAGLSANDQALVLDHPHPSLPIGEQPLSWGGLGQTMLETGKGFVKGAGRDIYNALGSPGAAVTSSVPGGYSRPETRFAKSIREATEPSNTSQKIGNYAETAATLLPMVEAAGPGARAFLETPPRSYSTVPDIPSAPQGSAAPGGLAELVHSAVRPFVDPVVARAGKVALEKLPNPRLLARSKAAINAYRGNGLPRPSLSAEPADIAADSSPVTGPLPEPKLPSGRTPGPAPVTTPLPRPAPKWQTNGIQADAPTSEPQSQGPLPQPTLPSKRMPGGIGNQKAPPPAVTPAIQAPSNTPTLDEIAQGYGYKSFSAIRDQKDRNVIFSLQRRYAESLPTQAAQQSLPAPTVNGRPVLNDEHGNPVMYADNPATAPASSGQALPPSQGLPAPKPVHEAAHAIDTYFSPRKAMNLTRHLREQGVPFNEVNAMVSKAKQTGDWSQINKLEQDAWLSGKALETSGQYKPGELVPKTKYRPKTADYSGIEGAENTEGTWDRVLATYPRAAKPVVAPLPQGISPPTGIPPPQSAPAWGLQ